MKPEELASLIIDVCADSDIVEDYEIEIHENVVLRCRISITKGFVDMYANFETDKRAFAWIVEGERTFGADNTDEWHLHPYENPEEHQSSDPVSLSEFLDRVEEILKRKEL